MTSGSPYATALGGRMAQLHPALRTYFSTIPEGCAGIGEGVFDAVGTRRRWLSPLLAPLQRRGVAWAGWAEDVPFRVVNRTVGGTAVARRELSVPGGRWTMADAVSPVPRGGVVDRIGAPAVVAAAFDVDVVGGALVLSSRSAGVRWGRLRMRVPRPLAPRIRLRESHDGALGRQRVELTVDLPVLGRVYEYAGTFCYRIECAGDRQAPAPADSLAAR